MRLAAFLTLFAAPAVADCAGETFLSCPIEGRADHLEVCIEPGAFTYAFGPRGAPELRLTARMQDGPVTPWPGVGRAIWSAVIFKNEGYAYEVWASVDRMVVDETGTEAPVEAGVSVLQGEATVARLACAPGTADTDPYRLSDAMYENGWCWEIADHLWRKGTDCN